MTVLEMSERVLMQGTSTKINHSVGAPLSKGCEADNGRKGGLHPEWRQTSQVYQSAVMALYPIHTATNTLITAPT